MKTQDGILPETEYFPVSRANLNLEWRAETPLQGG